MTGSAEVRKILLAAGARDPDAEIAGGEALAARWRGAVEGRPRRSRREAAAGTWTRSTPSGAEGLDPPAQPTACVRTPGGRGQRRFSRATCWETRPASKEKGGVDRKGPTGSSAPSCGKRASGSSWTRGSVPDRRASASRSASRRRSRRTSRAAGPHVEPVRIPRQGSRNRFSLRAEENLAARRRDLQLDRRRVGLLALGVRLDAPEKRDEPPPEAERSLRQPEPERLPGAGASGPPAVPRPRRSNPACTCRTSTRGAGR